MSHLPIFILCRGCLIFKYFQIFWSNYNLNLCSFWQIMSFCFYLCPHCFNYWFYYNKDENVHRIALLERNDHHLILHEVHHLILHEKVTYYIMIFDKNHRFIEICGANLKKYTGWWSFVEEIYFFDEIISLKSHSNKDENVH